MLLDTARLREQLIQSPVGHTVDYYGTIPSTMPIAHQLAQCDETRSGVVVVAEEQTAGRGRLQRQWNVPPGEALLFSVIVKPPLPFPLPQLPMTVGVALAEALETLFPELIGEIGLKWPNDVLLGATVEAVHKVAGILIETAFQGEDLVYAIVGVGINVNQAAAALPLPSPGAPPPTSLRFYLQRTQELDRTALLVALCRSLSHWLSQLATPQTIFDVWRDRLWTLGQNITVLEAGEPVWRGRALDVDADGSLFVEDETGVRRRFAAGEVSLRQA